MNESAATISGSGTLRVVRVGERSVVHTARATSPMKLLLPNNHGEGVWAFVASFGGGLVDGDALALDVDVDVDATLFLGTQASTKAYRAERGTSQSLRARVGEAALLAIVLDPVACFAGSRHAQRADIELAPSGSLVLVDAMTSGRAASGERWDLDRYASRTRVARAGEPLALDAVLLDPAHGDLRGRMGRFDAMATIIATGPRVRALRDSLLGAPKPERRAPTLLSASPLGDDGVLARLVADDVGRATTTLRSLLAPLADALGDDPFARKW